MDKGKKKVDESCSKLQLYEKNWFCTSFFCPLSLIALEELSFSTLSTTMVLKGHL